MRENPGEERLQDDLSPVFPSDKIVCKDCAFRKSGIIGYKNAYCKVYTSEIGAKPNGILFDNKKCEYYQKE